MAPETSIRKTVHIDTSLPFEDVGQYTLEQITTYVAQVNTGMVATVSDRWRETAAILGAIAELTHAMACCVAANWKSPYTQAALDRLRRAFVDAGNLGLDSLKAHLGLKRAHIGISAWDNPETWNETRPRRNVRAELAMLGVPAASPEERDARTKLYALNSDYQYALDIMPTELSGSPGERPPVVDTGWKKALASRRPVPGGAPGARGPQPGEEPGGRSEQSWLLAQGVVGGIAPTGTVVAGGVDGIAPAPAQHSGTSLAGAAAVDGQQVRDPAGGVGMSRGPDDRRSGSRSSFPIGRVPGAVKPVPGRLGERARMGPGNQASGDKKKDAEGERSRAYFVVEDREVWGADDEPLSAVIGAAPDEPDDPAKDAGTTPAVQQIIGGNHFYGVANVRGDVIARDQPDEPNKG